MILISITALHRQPSIWGPTADEFDPKRWLNPRDEFKSNFIPFLTGARSCIGNKVALNEFKIMLSVLIRNFVFRPVEGLNIRKKMGSKIDPYLELIVSKVEA
jgi:cytochrome P450